MGLFDAIGDAVSSVVDTVSDVVDTVGDLAGALGPIASIAGLAFPPLGIAASVAGMVSGAVGQAVNLASKTLADESGMPKFLLGDIFKLVESVVGGLKGDTDPKCDHACSQEFGPKLQEFAEDFGKSIADFAKGILDIGTEETQGAKGGSSSWLTAIAKAMGEAAGKHADNLVKLSKQIQDAAGSKEEGAAGKATALQAEFQAEAQMFSMLQNAFSTAIKSIGEGMTTMARK